MYPFTKVARVLRRKAVSPVVPLTEQDVYRLASMCPSQVTFAGGLREDDE